ncbi:unnamed protein product [Absidia cylindrospora]
MAQDYFGAFAVVLVWVEAYFVKPLLKWTRDNRGYSRWDHYGPPDVADEEEQWTLDDWEEHLDDDDEHGDCF